MNPTELASRLGGVIGFPLTPFNEGDPLTIDTPAFRNHVDSLAGTGLSALVVAGGTGEFFSLKPAEIVHLARESISVVGGRMPVLVGVGHGAATGSELARELEGLGVDGLLMMPPYYPTPDPVALVDYYAAIAAGAPHTGLVVYCRDHARLDATSLRSMASIKNLVAVKDGLGDIRLFVHNRAALGDRFTWLGGAGDDLVGGYAAAGAAGYTSSLACIDADLSLRLWELAKSGSWADLDVLMRERVTPWYALRTRRRGYEVSTIKLALSLRGQMSAAVRPPLAQVDHQDSSVIHSLMAPDESASHPTASGMTA